jgi:hypothetical protein
MFGQLVSNCNHIKWSEKDFSGLQTVRALFYLDDLTDFASGPKDDNVVSGIRIMCVWTSLFLVS